MPNIQTIYFTDCNKIKKYVFQFKPHKALSIDNLTLQTVHGIADLIAPHLVWIINKRLQ